ncbi:hypothetical protein TREMEDRAFT_36788, partial [Tremella mesenterica DSM 1558]|uniref:uncharacterized protein n=1 Tax=Tremella mesenterica (strain ATCC 24925 / CBS 8224 / DSM 1558 / NBRC 9311 / NRRL Y-6157 / RJB 2259-6 / UBC 559-6) TaxID=578456 RepID=UPI0003F499A5
MSSTSSNAPPSYGDLLDDEALAPLKRNHACLQCKKRKVKCDGTRPSCAPCLRSHAHALRSAQRNSSTPPILTCTYTEVETPDSRGNSPPSDPLRSVNETEQRKRRGAKRHHDDGDSEEKAALLAKITELEQQLAALRPLASLSEKSSLKQSYSGGGNIWSNEPVSFIDNQQNWDGGIPPLALPPVDPTGFENLFLVPTGWPRNLPSPFLLEHLVETFFTHVPQLPRMLHRASFLPRIQLPPTNPNFPDAALLHAICARASLHTAWVNSIPPEQVESVIERHKAINNDLEGLDDFGLSQVEAARRCIHLAFTTCDMAGGPRLLEQCMAGVIIADVYFSKGVPMLGWEAAGVPGRMVRVLELNNRNLPKERHKDALLSPPVDSIDREARLGLLWNAFLADSGFALNGGWGRSFELSDMRTQLPGSECDFQKGVYVEENPQNAQSPDLYNNHPVQDPFVLSIKAAVLSCRASRWLHFWQQRDIIPGDDMTGLRHPDFLTLVHDLHDFKRTVPDAVKNLFKICEVQGPQALDADVLTIHILPNLSLALLYEPFVQTQNAETDDALYKIRRACDSIIGILHLIPTNLDVATIMTPVIGFSLYSVGRLIANDIQRLMSASKFEQALKVRGDLSTVQAMLGRYGQQHALGLAMVNFLDHYL